MQNGRQPQFFLKMEDDLNFFENARRPYCHKLKMTSIFFFKRKTTSTYLRIEDDLKKAQHILPGNLTNTTTISKLAQFKQKINLTWL